MISFEQEFGPYKEEIAQLYEDIHFETFLASKQAQKQENELSARERSTNRKLFGQLTNRIHQSYTEGKASRMEIDRWRSRKRKTQALDSLSTYDYQKTYKQIRKECIRGTSEWILGTSEFEIWKEGTPKGLWCSGKCK